MTTTGVAVSAATAAGLTTLARQAAVSLINNQGDVSKTLEDLGSEESVKQIVASMLTAGVGGYYSGTYNLENFIAKTATGCAARSFDCWCYGRLGLAWLGLAWLGLAWAGNTMRQDMFKDSKNFDGVVGSDGVELSNKSGQSVGVNGDLFKLAGGRVSLTAICSDGYAKCLLGKDNNLVLDSQGRVQYQGSLQKFIADNPGLRSPMGGWQGGEGMFAFFDYKPGSIFDRVAEAYAGPHDKLNSAIWYDSSGNIKNGVAGSWLGTIGDITSYTNVLLATPFAIPILIPSETIDAIRAGIKFNKKD